jgi:hypothetical protein
MVSRLLSKVFELHEAIDQMRNIASSLTEIVGKLNGNIPLKLQPQEFPHYLPPRNELCLLRESVEHLLKLLGIGMGEWNHGFII